MFIKFLSNIIGYPYDQLQYLACMLACYFLSNLFRKISIFNYYAEIKLHSDWKHLFSMCISLSMTWYCFGFIGGVYHTLFIILGCYGLYKHCLAPKLSVFIFTFLYLSVLQFRILYSHYMEYIMNVTGIVMILVIKMTSLTDADIEYIKNEGNIVEWMGYSLFFPAFLTGPALSFKDYQNFIDSKNDWDDSIENNVSAQQSLRNAALVLIPTMLQMFFPITYIATTQFGQLSILKKFIYLYFTMFFTRCKYYFAWFLAEANCRTIGLTTQQSKNFNIMKVEFADNPKELLENWNIFTAKWLKNFVYLPLYKGGFSKSGATYATNIVSAFWHGFYPGYYFTFLLGGIYTKLGRDFYRYGEYIPLNSFSNKFYISKLVTILLVMFSAPPFPLYGFQPTLDFYSNVYYYGVFMIIAGFCASFYAKHFYAKQHQKLKNI